MKRNFPDWVYTSNVDLIETMVDYICNSDHSPTNAQMQELLSLYKERIAYLEDQLDQCNSAYNSYQKDH